MKKVMTLQVPVKAVDGEEGFLDHTTLGSVYLDIGYMQSSDIIIMICAGLDNFKKLSWQIHQPTEKNQELPP